jgi:hypothetical protein
MPQLIITNTPARAAGEQINTTIQEHVGDVVCILSGGTALDIVEYIQPGKKCFHADCHGELCEKSECRTIFIMGDERVSGSLLLIIFYNYRSGILSIQSCST